ncbi:MAG: hypothetical protein JWM76_1777 [Pseudonocardiales bacterium]|nr:hypothetical protein [Pseudonocardiales bacterium]
MRGPLHLPRGSELKHGLQASMAVPFSVFLMCALVASTWWIQLSGVDADSVMDWASTDVQNLVSRPVSAIVASAVLIPDQDWIVTVALVALAAIPLERRIGSLRTMAVFASGHVLATIATEGFVAVRIALGSLPDSEANRVDVGSSYGMWALFGALFYFAGRHRRYVVVLAFAYLGVQAGRSPDVLTSSGHLISLAIGLCWWPVLTRSHVSAGRARQDGLYADRFLEPEFGQGAVAADAHVARRAATRRGARAGDESDRFDLAHFAFRGPRIRIRSPR